MKLGATTRRLLALAAAFACGACSSATAPPAANDGDIRRAIAGDVGEAIAADVALALPAGTSAAVSFATLQGTAAGGAAPPCPGPGRDGWFSCLPVLARGVTVVRAYRYWDGRRLASAFTAATDSVNRRRAITGSFTRHSGKRVWVNRGDTATMHIVRGLQPRQVVDAVGTRADSTRVDEEGKTLRLFHTSSDTTIGLTRAEPRRRHPWPIAGTVIERVTTIAHVRDAQGERMRTMTHRVVVTFDGKRVVTLTVGDVSCLLDLQSRKVFNCH